MATFQSKFKLGDQVQIDGDNSIRARVVGVWFGSNGQWLQLAWVHNGEHRAEWIDEWRISEWRAR